MTLEELHLRGFRNLQPTRLQLPRGLVLLLGPNGAGKTNFLEAIAVLGNLASFRPGPPLAWVQQGSTEFLLEGRVHRPDTTLHLGVHARAGRHLHRHLFRGGRRLQAPEYLPLFPVAAFSTADRALLSGPPETRRRFLDRLAFHLRPETYTVLQSYRRALRQRNAALQAGAQPRELEAFEHHLALLGSRLLELRLAVLPRLQRTLAAELAAFAWPLSPPALRYNDPDGVTPGPPAEVAGRLRLALARHRPRERARGFTMVGPHRHDVEFYLGAAPARAVLSAGQGKLFVTALKFAAMAVMEHAHGLLPLVVFDDVDAELDADALARLVERLAARPQAFLSSAHAAMLAPFHPRGTLFQVNAGRLSPAPART